MLVAPGLAASLVRAFRCRRHLDDYKPIWPVALIDIALTAIFYIAIDNYNADPARGTAPIETRHGRTQRGVGAGSAQVAEFAQSQKLCFAAAAGVTAAA